MCSYDAFSCRYISGALAVFAADIPIREWLAPNYRADAEVQGFFQI